MLCPLLGGELGPHLTQCGLAEAYLRAKFHLDPSNRLATIYTNITDRHDIQAGQTDRTDNGPIAYGEPF